MTLQRSPLIVATSCVLLSGACSAPHDTPVASSSVLLAGPDGRGLQSVPRPELDAMGSTVQQRVSAAYGALATTIADRTAAPERLATAYGEVGHLLMALRELETAEPYYLNAQTLAPSDRRWPHLLGHLYRTRGPLDKAVASFERARQLAPDDVATLVRLGEAYLASARTDEAASHFDRAIALNPRSAAAWFGVGRVSLERGDDRAAVKAFEEALARDEAATAIHYPLALAYRRLGDTTRAETHLARRGDVEPRPDDPLMAQVEGRIETALTLDFRGGEALAGGNWGAAATYFERALALTPDNPSLRHRLGTALFRMGDLRGAEEQFEQVVRAAPASRESHYNLAMIKAGSGRMEPAIAQLSTALEHEPGYSRARVAVARLLAVTGRPADALVQYAAALKMEPLHPDATLGYAMTLALVDRYAESRDRLTDGIRTFPDRPAFKRALARLMAAAPDEKVRNGRQALMMAEALLERRQSSAGDGLAVGETYAMALAESGQHAAAAAVQRDVCAAAQQGGGADADLGQRLADNLSRYERGLPSRRPWTPQELPF